MGEGEPQTRVHEPQGPWAHHLRDLTSPEYLAMEKLVGWLANNTTFPGLAYATPEQVIDAVIEFLEQSRKLTTVTYDMLEPHLRRMVRGIVDEGVGG